MIKLIIFDLDGVLVEARDVHYHALNGAIQQIAGMEYVIHHDEHLSTYDGLPTTKKLKMLTEKKGLSEDLYHEIWEAKQKQTGAVLKKTLSIDEQKCKMLKDLRDMGYKIYCASNSISDSVRLMLFYTGMMEHIDWWISNEDVKNAKPHPEMYLECMIRAGISPRHTLIVEDSHRGREAAIEAGAHLCAVENAEDTTFEKVWASIEHADYRNRRNISMPKWQDKKMNVVIPMAGAGSRFQEAGYTFPKPLIEINGKPMIQIIVENLNMDANFIFIVQKEHYEKYNLKYLLNLITPNCTIIPIESITEGAACTTLLAKEFINNDDHLLLANSDQFVEWDSNEFMYTMINDKVDAGILSFKATHPKWSFAKLGPDGFVIEVAEKKPISDIATVGIYYWKHGSDYVNAAEQMIEKDIRINNEFYVCPVFNQALIEFAKIKTYMVEKMWGLGTPEDLERFVEEYDTSKL